MPCHSRLACEGFDVSKDLKSSSSKSSPSTYHNLIREIAYGFDWGKHKIRPNRYVELGIYKAQTFNLVAPIFKIAHAVDSNPRSESHITAPNAVWHNRTTDSFISTLDKQFVIDMVFIDALHTHDQSLKDFLGIIPFVRPNGLILLHDTYPYKKQLIIHEKCGDVYKTAWTIRNTMKEEFEIVTLPFYFGLSVIRKADKQLMWKK